MCGFTIMGLEDIISSVVLMAASYHMQHINPNEKCRLRQFTRRATGWSGSVSHEISERLYLFVFAQFRTENRKRTFTGTALARIACAGVRILYSVNGNHGGYRMNPERRGVLAFLGGLVLARPSLSAASSKPPAFAESRSNYQPRHVLCFLGTENGLAALQQSARAAVDTFATDFSIDEEFSLDEADDRMERSFNVCWDRVDPEAYQKADESAVARHGSVLYVLGPSMDAEAAVRTSANALRFVQHMLDHGAVAVKGESAGVAHGARRWKELFEQSLRDAAADDMMALARTCRLAFARRPIGGDAEGMTSVGFHLVGLPDVQIRFTRKNEVQPSTNIEQLKIAALIDDVADQMTRDGVETALKDRHAALSDDTRYEEDEYKFNPFGLASIQDYKL